MENKLNIVNRELKFQKVNLVRPRKSHYLLISVEMDKTPFPFFLTTSNKKKESIERFKNWCATLGKEFDIIGAVVFKARLIPPGRGKFLEQRKEVHIAKFDVVVLIETAAINGIETIRNSTEFKKIKKFIEDTSIYSEIIQATNVKCINPVNHNKQGVFLFNYFYGDNLEQNLGVWEYTAGWFQQETDLDNSTVLLPADNQQTNYTIINHCRWDKMSNILPSLIFKKSFRSYVLDNFFANNVAAMPVLYKMA